LIAEYRIKASVAFGGGIIMWVAGQGLAKAGIPKPLGITADIASILTFAYGGTMYMRAKGYSPILGLIGALPLIGLVLLFLIPDRNQNAPDVFDDRKKQLEREHAERTHQAKLKQK